MVATVAGIEGGRHKKTQLIRPGFAGIGSFVGT